jgi:predicted nucleic acid-binding protein
MRDFRGPLPFTPLHRHELRNAIRLAVFRRQIDEASRSVAFDDMESDLADGILAHVAIPWSDAFRESEKIGALHTEAIGVRGIDLLHAGVALALGAKEFLTFDARQASLAKAAGLKVKL